MRQLPLVIGLFVCLGLAACSASQDNSASANTPKIAAAERPDAATEQTAVTEGAVTSGTPLTHVTINGKKVDPKYLPAGVREKLLAHALATKPGGQHAFLTEDKLPPGAIVVDDKQTDAMAAMIEAAKAGAKDGDVHIVISDQEMSPEMLAKMKAAMASAQQIEAKAASRRVGKPFPVRQLERLDGGAIELTGRTSVINFWASWCKPCLEEMPLFEQLAKRRPDLQIATLNVDFSREDMEKVLAKRPFKLATSRDEGMVLYAALEVSSLPLTLVLDAEGVIRHQYIGSVPDYEKLLAALKLNDQSPTVATAP